MPTTSRFVTVNGVRLHYLEDGEGPPILFLHGIPTSARLWRDVLPRVASYGRALALDLVGCGDSDKPLELVYDLPTQARFLGGFADALGLRGLVLVSLDLGLLVALQAARESLVDVRGLVLMEGLVLPIGQALRALPLGARIMLRLLRVRALAERTMVRDGEQTLGRMLSAWTVRPLGADEVEACSAPWRDAAVRRRVWLEGVGPHTLVPRSRAAGDLTDLVARNAAWLETSPLPKLLLYGEPGAVLPRAEAEAAGARLPRTTVRSVGSGKHLLPEDQPEAIAREVVAFCRGLAAAAPVR